MPICITSAASYIPEEIITNKDLSGRFKQKFDIEDWILQKTGIVERRKSNLSPSKQGFLAAKDLLEKNGNDIDFIIVNTFTGDYTLPQTATLIQEKLGLDQAFAFEINMPCAGPVYAISIAEMFLKSGRYTKGLLIGVDKMLDAIDPDDFLMNVLFGEGAGALIVEKKESTLNKGIIDFYLGSYIEGDVGENYSLKVLAGKSNYPIQNYVLNQKDHFLQMEGRKVKNFIYEKLNESIEWLLKKHIESVDDLDYIITHQANKVVIEKCLKDQGIPSSKILKTVEFLGNTGSGSIYITIAEHFARFCEKNKKILICGMGGGLTWGAIFYKT